MNRHLIGAAAIAGVLVGGVCGHALTADAPAAAAHPQFSSVALCNHVEQLASDSTSVQVVVVEDVCTVQRVEPARKPAPASSARSCPTRQSAQWFHSTKERLERMPGEILSYTAELLRTGARLIETLAELIKD